MRVAPFSTKSHHLKNVKLTKIIALKMLLLFWMRYIIKDIIKAVMYFGKNFTSKIRTMEE